MSQVQLKNFVLFPGVRSCPSAAFREEFCPSVMPWETPLKLLECQEQQHFSKMTVLGAGVHSASYCSSLAHSNSSSPSSVGPSLAAGT